MERPASVVKELVENSLDAGADRIEIEIEGGGTRLIRIIDNGEGMDEDDVLLCLERHGTSKIHQEDDLKAIDSLGFRGEAIPSIGSVSKMSITSRREEQPLGTRAEIVYGKLLKVHEAGCAPGTIFEIKQLFGNTPARKKFLKTVRTELNHIEEVVKNYSLANPQVTFSYSVNGRRTIYLDSSLSLEARLGKILHYNGKFLKVGDETAEENKHKVFGYLIPPEKLRNSSGGIRLLVNGRAIRDRMMVHGVAEGLRGFLMKGKSPAGLIHLQLPAEEIDVNVHPAKSEVRFTNSRDIHYLIVQAVSETMRKEQRHMQTAIFGQKSSSTTPVPTEPVSYQQKLPTTSQKEYTQPPPAPKIANRESKSEDVTVQTASSGYDGSQRRGEESAERFLTTAEKATPHNGLADIETGAQNHELSAPSSESHNLEILGQLGDLYIFCRNVQGLVVIDQHAAHERLLYEELRKQYTAKAVAKQNLLFPVTVELSLSQLELVEKHGDELDHMGFSIAEFGQNSYIISAVPALAGKHDPETLFTEVLEQFGIEGAKKDISEQRIDTILSTMACRAAVKGGTSLGNLEIEALLNKMAEADLFSHCPHGRPVFKQFTMEDMKKWFHRT